MFSVLFLWCFLLFFFVFFFSSRRRHTRCREVSWARRCVQETDAEYMGAQTLTRLYNETLETKRNNNQINIQGKSKGKNKQKKKTDNKRQNVINLSLIHI
eukprot:TRINITY_DN15944_c0_g1_i1.p3 TRINITY_DN15944_c0_g1~~TRINITY_DN15944_c0_g1_i1.p3  ORF type:complete len:100 (-),score=33.71 TRINITY_DN15944_c0_g1_i1:188-487(-)